MAKEKIEQSQAAEKKVMLTRKPRTEWAAHAIHEYKELLRDAALLLVQNAPEDKKEEVTSAICYYLIGVREEIEDLFVTDEPNPEFELDEIYEIDPDKVGKEALARITDETEQIRRELQSALAGKDYFGKMNAVPFVLVGFLDMILDLKQAVRKITEEPLSPNEIEDDEFEGMSDKCRELLSKILKWVNPTMPLCFLKAKIIDRLMGNYEIETYQELSKRLDLNEDIKGLFEFFPQFSELQWKVNDYMRVYNWMISELILLAQKGNVRELQFIAQQFTG